MDERTEAAKQRGYWTLDDVLHTLNEEREKYGGDARAYGELSIRKVWPDGGYDQFTLIRPFKIK